MRRVAWLSALLLAATAAGLAGSAPVGRAAEIFPSIYVDYDDDCVFSMHADGGTALTATTAPGATIPPGWYQVVLRVPQDAPSCPLLFQLKGPGVDLEWDFGGEALGAQVTQKLLPASTYTAVDLRNPVRYRAVFTTSASGSSSGLVGPAPDTSTGKGDTSHDLVGSAAARARGVLNVVVGAGIVRLEAAKGKAVHSVRAGIYRLLVNDKTAHGGLTVREPDSRTKPVTGVRFVGRQTVFVLLTRGTWSFATSGSRPVRVVVLGRPA